MCDRVNLEDIIDVLEQAVREEYDDDTDVYDRICETVDGSEWVIYYSKAARVVDSVDDDEREEAFAADLDNGGRGGAADTFAQLRCRMAYYILEARLTERVRDLL